MKNVFYIGLFIIMLAPLLKIFGMSRPAPDITIGAIRHIDLSGNTLSFAMPESFSTDMPAEPIVESLNINSLQENKVGILAQRWWDIKEPGFFGKALGSVMMTVNVHQVPQNTRKLYRDSEYNITDRLDFIFMLDEHIHRNYNDREKTGNDFDHSIPEIFYLLGNNLRTEYRDILVNDATWTRYSIAGHNNLLIVNYILPLNEQSFIHLDFHYAPNDGIFPRYFRDHAYKITEPILQSLQMEYKHGNPIKNITERQWVDKTAEQALNEHTEDLVKKLFPPESYKDFMIRKSQKTKGLNENSR